MIGGSLFSGVIVYIVKGFFSAQEERVSKAEQNFSFQLKEVKDKTEKISDNHAAIYNDILNKFSNWEDRIKKTLDEMLSKKIGNSAGEVTPEEFKDNILKSFSKLDQTIKRDMTEVKRSMDIMDHHIRKTEKMVNSMKLNDEDKNALRQVLKALNQIENDKNKQLEEMDEKLVKIASVVKVLIADNKTMEKKFSNLVELSKNRISLKD